MVNIAARGTAAQRVARPATMPMTAATLMAVSAPSPVAMLPAQPKPKVMNNSALVAMMPVRGTLRPRRWRNAG